MKRIQLGKMINDFLAEAEKKSKLPKPKKEKHNPLYHQSEPVGYQKPKTIKEGEKCETKDGQKEVNDKNTETSKEAIEKTDLTEAQKFRNWQEGIYAALDDTDSLAECSACGDEDHKPMDEESRFDKLSHKLSHEKGIYDPDALAASIGRKKYGKKGFAHLAHEGTDAMSQSVEIGDPRGTDEDYE